ncbi:unnamed protein product [Tenebrio molitor]|nr:unnamed protein product [Tenebrio molitor]
MVVKYWVFGCKNSFKKHSTRNISFHPFPKENKESFL